MKLEDMVNIGTFIESLTPPVKDVFRIWSETAFQIGGDRYEAIARIRDIYMEIPEAELKPRQIIMFIEALLNELPSDEMKKSLIRTEALRFRKFD